MANELIKAEEFFEQAAKAWGDAIRKDIDDLAEEIERDEGMPRDVARHMAEFLVVESLNRMAFANWLGPVHKLREG